MRIKICNVILEDWGLFAGNIWSRYTSIDCMNSIELHKRKNGWETAFYRDFMCLESIFSGPKYFSNVDEGKQFIDEWLLRISKLKAFW